MSVETNHRILAIDDQAAILEDYRKILGGGDAAASEGLQDARSAFFGGAVEPVQARGPDFELHTAGQGQEGIDLHRAAIEAGRPFAVAFVDVRMPPGLDGMQTIKGLWKDDPRLQVVICTAYSDYSFEQIVGELGSTDRLLILKKPFDPVEVRQLAGALSEKWNATERERERVEELQQAEREASARASDLAEANVRAEAASRAKSEFVANMSHEIRTPMNALLGYVDLLCDPVVTDEERNKYCDTLRSSGEHLLTIVNDILDLSRIEASRMVINQSDFPPVEVAREVASLLIAQASEKDLDLQIQVPAPIPAVIESDRVRLRQILLNLVGNAIKFTESGYVRIVIRLDEHEQASDRYVYFDVIDTGVGIAPEQLAEIFHAFSQVDTSLTRRVGGTGLGLAISKRLALLLGGDVEVESTPGKGSTFSLRLHVGALRPAALVSHTPQELCLNRVDLPAAAPPEPGTFHGRVLLVEDVKFNQVLVAALLRKAGATVVVAEDGREGFEKAMAAESGAEPFDVVLMDMQMPVMDGYEASRKLRAEGFRRPIVALTAHAMSEDRDKCLLAGCTDYMTKPLDRRALIEMCCHLAQPEPAPPLPSQASGEPAGAGEEANDSPSTPLHGG